METKKKSLSFLTTAAELQNMKIVPSQWVVDQLLRVGRRRISLLLSLPESGKSTLARQLAVCVSKGRSFFCRQTKRCPILYWQTEDAPEDLQESFNRLGYNAATDEPIYIFHGAANDNTLDNFDAVLTAHPEIKLVIIETLDDLLRVDDIKENTAAREAFETFDKAFAKHSHRVGCLALHHLKKTENKTDAGRDILGATNVRGRTDAKWYLHIADDDDSPIKRRLFEATIRRGRPIEKTYLDYNPETETSTLGETYAASKAADAGRNQERIETDILKYFAEHPGHSFADQCRPQVAGNSTQKRQAFKRLLASGRILKQGRGVSGQPAQYHVAEIPAELQAQFGEAIQ
jgi:AAA domain